MCGGHTRAPLHISAATKTSTEDATLTELVFPRVTGELDDEQIAALAAAADAVDVGDVGALGGGALEDAVHLGVGGVGELDDGAGLVRREAGERLLLPGWRRAEWRETGCRWNRRGGGEYKVT